MSTKVFAATDRRIVLSMLWVFVVFNYLYADFIILIFRPGMYESIASRAPTAVMLVATLLMEILLVMAFLSRVLVYTVNRWANIVAGVIGTLFVGVTLGPRAPAVYVILAGIEMISTLFIVWYAWTWRQPAAAPAELGAA